MDGENERAGQKLKKKDSKGAGGYKGRAPPCPKVSWAKRECPKLFSGGSNGRIGKVGLEPWPVEKCPV